MKNQFLPDLNGPPENKPKPPAGAKSGKEDIMTKLFIRFPETGKIFTAETMEEARKSHPFLKEANIWTIKDGQLDKEIQTAHME